MIKNKRVFVSLFSLLALFCALLQYWPVVIHVKGSSVNEDFTIRMPLKDKRRLEYFFRHVSFLEVWAYTTIGSKPMSLCQYTKPKGQIYKALSSPRLRGVLRSAFWPPDFREIFYLVNPEALKIHWGHKAFKKYFKRFSNSRFAFLTYSEGDAVCMTLVDKVKLQEILSEHLDDFRSVFDSLSIEPIDLLEDNQLRVFLKNVRSEALMGILLGYGKNNSLYFEKHCYADADAMEPMWPDELGAWMERINRKDRTFQPWDVSDLFYPRFSCIPSSEETLSLVRMYKEDREKIVLYCEDKDVVEATLSLFNERIR